MEYDNRADLGVCLRTTFTVQQSNKDCQMGGQAMKRNGVVGQKGSPGKSGIDHQFTYES
jgi:hypothetical protein